jgi:putative SOS response-associated peptidase YedK
VCGRFLLHEQPRRYAALLDAQLEDGVEESFRRSWNVPPTRRILGAVENPDGSRTLGVYRWGLIPSWTKDLSKIRNTFNARSERVATAPTFRAPFKRQRLLIPADGFYEWKTPPSGPKQPNLFRRSDGDPIVFAGLWDHWKDPDYEGDGDGWVRSATIITTAAGVDMDSIHDRMPVILEPDSWDRWLDPQLEDRDELEAMLVATEAGTLIHFPVSRSVGSIKNDSPELAEPILPG